MSSGSLIDKFLELIEVRGRENVAAIIEQHLAPEIKFDNPIAENIIRTICSKFCIPVEELIYGTGRKNDRKIAIGFCTYYLMNACGMSLGDAVDILKREESICRKSMKNVGKLNTKHVSDQPYLHYKNEFDLIFMKDKKN